MQKTETDSLIADRLRGAEQPQPEALAPGEEGPVSDVTSEDASCHAAAVVTEPAEAGILTLIMAEFHREQQWDDGIRDPDVEKATCATQAVIYTHLVRCSCCVNGPGWFMAATNPCCTVAYNQSEAHQRAFVMPQQLRRELLEQSFRLWRRPSGHRQAGEYGTPPVLLTRPSGRCEGILPTVCGVRSTQGPTACSQGSSGLAPSLWILEPP